MFKKASIDEASLSIFNEDAVEKFEVWGQSEECFLCSPWKYLSLNPGQNRTLVVNSTYPTYLFIRSSLGQEDFHRYKYHFVQHGVYSLKFNSTYFPTIETIQQGSNEFIAILVASLIYLLLYVSWIGGKRLVKKLKEIRQRSSMSAENGTNSSPVTESNPASTRVSGARLRLKSLDAFRGLTISIMIFVNYGGGKYYFFKHAAWNGLTVADLVFPWFLWIMGVSLFFSINSQFKRFVPFKLVFLRIVKRSFILFALGIMLNSLRSNYLPDLRILGVLQRFSFCYFLVTVLEAIFWKPIIVPDDEDSSQQNGAFWWLKDVMSAAPQLLIVFGLVGLHSLLTFFLHVPNCPTGYLGPGGLHAYGNYNTCAGGAAAYIDRLLISEDHLYSRPASHTIYDSLGRFDPEGILGTLNACLTVQLGVVAGRIILHYPRHSARVIRFILWALVMGIFGGCLCSWKKEGGPIPVNKKLWSLSFVSITASFAFFLLAFLYGLVDWLKKWGGSVFRVAGMNSILLYIGHEMTHHLFPWSWTPLPATHSAHLAMNLWGTSIWLIIAVVLHRKKLYLSI